MRLPPRNLDGSHLGLEKNIWKIKASHDAYDKSFGVVHERQINYSHQNNKLIGCEKLIKNGYKVENLIEFPGH